MVLWHSRAQLMNCWSASSCLAGLVEAAAVKPAGKEQEAIHVAVAVM